MGKVGFSPIIGLAVVVALAMAAVFGAMSLANPAQADIASSPAPTVKVTAGGIMEDQEGTAVVPATSPPTFTYDADKYTVSNFAGATDRTYVIEFTVTGAYESEDAILIEMPGVAPTDSETFTGSNDITPVTVRAAPVATDGNTGPSVANGSGTAYQRFTERGVKGLEGDPQFYEVELANRSNTDAAARVRVTISGLTNPTKDGPNTVKIHHYDDDNTAANDASGGDEVAEVSTQTASYSINSVMAMQEDNGDYIITFYAQQEYDTGDELVITMEDFSLPSSILREDVYVGDSPARDVTVDSSESTITVELPRPGISDGAMAVVTIYESADVRATEEGLHQIDVGGASTVGENGLRIGEVPEKDDTGLVGLPRFTPGSEGAGGTTSYTVEFEVTADVNTRQDDLVIEFHEDYTVPSSIRNTSVAITTDTEIADSDKDVVTFTPEDVTVDGNEIFISVGDIDERDDDFEYTFAKGDKVTVLFRQSAGISNPTGAGDYEGIVAITFGGVEYDETPAGFAETIPHSISIDPEDGGLGEVVTVKGKGFKNGTSLTVFRDDDNDGKLTSADDVLCEDTEIEGNLGICEFEVTHPTFEAGLNNRINAVDGVNKTAAENKTKVFELTASVSTSPKGGSPGEMLLVQVVDFEGNGIDEVQIGGEIYCHDSVVNRLGVLKPCGGGIDQQGSGNFSIEIPNWARGGLQELKVWDNASPRTSASTKVTLVGPQIRLTNKTVIANQRVSLIGTGFSPGASIANVENLPATHTAPVIRIGGDPIDEGRINDGDPVRVDNGGNWSASVDLPLSEATTSAGDRIIRVRDSLARTGVVEVNIPLRKVDVTPEVGRVGTIALIEGKGFPSKNDEGSSFNVEIEYEASNGNTVTISALTDASGRFEAQLRIPTTAAIPSSNQVHVRFNLDSEGGVPVTVPLTVPHDVPEGIIKPSETSGGPGSTITLNGEGFKSFVPVSLVRVGVLDVTPAPKPSTDGNGMMSFPIIIPGLDVGIQTIEVSVGRTTASVGFTVTESGINPGDIKEVGAGLEDLGDNLVNIWHFNNDTKAWSFYDGMEGSDLTHLITGETYLIQIKSTIEVILNNDTRNLTCVGGNCWNQVVW